MNSIVATIDAMLDAAFVSDIKGNITALNKAACDLFGWQHNELLGQKVNVLMPEMYSTLHDKFIDTYMKTGSKKLIGVSKFFFKTFLYTYRFQEHYWHKEKIKLHFQF